MFSSNIMWSESNGLQFLKVLGIIGQRGKKCQGKCYCYRVYMVHISNFVHGQCARIDGTTHIAAKCWLIDLATKISTTFLKLGQSKIHCIAIFIDKINTFELKRIQ